MSSKNAVEGVLMGIGNPLLDISATVDASYLEKYGLESRNAILAEEKHLPMYQELVDDYDVEYIAGGSTQNSIRVAEWVFTGTGISSKRCTYIGCVGKDSFADEITNSARKDGVRVEYLVDEDTPTGTCAVLVTGSDRSLVANLAAANNYAIDHIKEPSNWALVQKAKYFYIGGFFITVSMPTILAVANHAADENKMFTMNLSAPFISEFFKDDVNKLTPYWDIIFGNKAEALAFAKSQEWEEKDIREIARRTADLPKKNSQRSRIVIFTQSDEPTIMCSDGEVTEYTVTAIPKEEIVDTNAAGDAFVGGFLSQLILGKSTKECIYVANKTAGLVIRRSGCTMPEPFDVATV